MKLHKQTLRTFFHSLGAAAVIALFLAFGGYRLMAAGFVTGAVLSLFSLFSLKICIPALFRSGASRGASALLQVVMFMKLPVFAVGLYLATRLGTAASFAAFWGCALVPCVISLEAVMKAIAESDRNYKRAAAMRPPVQVLPAVEELVRQVAEIKAEAREPLTVSSKTRTVREGAA